MGWSQSSVPGSIMIRPVLSLSPLSTNNESHLLKSPAEIQVYPNPADQYFHISFNDDNYLSLKVELFDLTGRLVYMSEQYPNQKVNTSAVVEGIYSLSISNYLTSDRFSQKIIIRH